MDNLRNAIGAFVAERDWEQFHSPKNLAMPLSVEIVEVVERMLVLHERLAEARIERERTVIGHQISAIDRQIDGLVYELYGLTENKIAIVEARNEAQNIEEVNARAE